MLMVVLVAGAASAANEPTAGSKVGGKAELGVIRYNATDAKAATDAKMGQEARKQIEFGANAGASGGAGVGRPQR